ncbi:MAG: DUF2619 domain-containing protein [Bacillota bacterium]
MDTKVLTMAIIRMMYGVFSFVGGVLIFRFNDLGQAVRINSFIGSIGPFVLLVVSAIGIAGLATQIPLRKVILLVAGVTLMLLGTR